MVDLYAILGVKPDATPEQVTKAYRKRARATHPDRGGDREEFEQVATAYAVLSDPTRRAHYDATGEVGDDPQQPIVQLIAEMMLQAVEMMVENAKTPEYTNVLGLIRTHLKGHIENESVFIQKLRLAETMLKRSQGRYGIAAKDTKAPADLLEGLTSAHLRNLKAQIAEHEAAKKLKVEALGLLKNYTYRCDEQGQWGFGPVMPDGLKQALGFKKIIMEHP